VASALGLYRSGLLIGAVSWRDDISGVPVGLRLTVHGIAAAITLWGLGYWQMMVLPVFGELSLGGSVFF